MSEVKQIIIQIRRPLGGDDCGVVEYGHYTYFEGIVTLCDESGFPLRRGVDEKLTTRTVRGRETPVWSAAVPDGHDDRMIANRLLHQKVSSEKSGSEFNAPLKYPELKGWR